MKAGLHTVWAQRLERFGSLRVATLAFASRYLALDLGIPSLTLSFFARESGVEAVESFPRPLDRFVCSLEGLMTLPQDIA